MAELILTEEEKAASTWLELPDETVGKLVKKIVADMPRLAKETDKITTTAILLMLVGYNHDHNNSREVYTLEGTLNKDIPTGYWRITVEKINS